MYVKGYPYNEADIQNGTYNIERYNVSAFMTLKIYYYAMPVKDLMLSLLLHLPSWPGNERVYNIRFDNEMEEYRSRNFYENISKYMVVNFDVDPRYINPYIAP